MANIYLTRCQFLIPFADILNDIGASTGSFLKQFHLPASLEEKANHYAPILQAIDFAEAAGRSQGIPDFGFHAARRLHYCHVSEKVRTLVEHSPTLLVALQQKCKWASVEDTNLLNWLEYHDDHVRFCSRLAGTRGLLHLEHSQWFQNIFPMFIVQQFAGPDWTPATIAFEARYTPSAACQSFWPNTRFLSGQDSSWIDVPISLLGLPNRANEKAPPSDDKVEPSGHDIFATLKLMLPSYVDEGFPSLAEIAEMAGASTRSFQRNLAHAGLTYSDLLEAIRFENASRLLCDTDAKIIEVAFSSGYTDPAHFTRAFRRMSGVTPRQFREQSRIR